MTPLDVILTTSDLPRAIAFYRDLFGSPPTRADDDRASFHLEDPPLHLVVLKAPAKSDHVPIGVSNQVECLDFVRRERERLDASGLLASGSSVGCLFTSADRLFIRDHDGNRWDIFRRPDDPAGGER